MKCFCPIQNVHHKTAAEHHLETTMLDTERLVGGAMDRIYHTPLEVRRLATCLELKYTTTATILSLPNEAVSYFFTLFEGTILFLRKVTTDLSSGTRKLQYYTDKKSNFIN